MLKFLNKFHKLPPNIQNAISDMNTVVDISDLEEKYDVDLFVIVIKLVVKDIKLDDLENILKKKYNISDSDAKNLKQDLIDKVLIKIKDYLDIKLKNELEAQTKIKKKLFLPKEQKTKRLKKYDHLLHKEEHIDVLISKTREKNKKDKSRIVGGDISDKIINSLGIRFSSKSKEFKFRTIISEYLRNVKHDKTDAKSSLTNKESDNGLGIEEYFAKKILKTCDKFLQDVNNYNLTKENNNNDKKQRAQLDQKIKPSLDLSQISKRDIDYNLADILEKKMKTIDKKMDTHASKIEKKEEGIQNNKITKAKTPVILVKNNDKKDKYNEQDNNQNSKIISKKNVNKNALNKFDISKRAVTEEKKKIQDIKKKPRLLNPISILKYMDTYTFRKLSDNPEDRIQKILNKINELGEISFSKKMEAIQAWRESLVNKLYIQIGRESISNKKPLKEIIKIRKDSGKDFLSIEEFMVIMKLNNKLREY